MSQSYKRHEYRLDVWPIGDEAQLRLAYPDGSVAEARIPRALLDAAARGDSTSLAKALKRSAVAERLDRLGPDEFSMSRVCLQLGERTWSSIDWEMLSGEQDPCLVRGCPVRPRIEQIPLTFPLRMLQAGGTPTQHTALGNVFGDSMRQMAVQDEFVASDAVQQYPAIARWPTVDVLHLSRVEPDSTLRAWLPRFLDQYQTRLLVLEVAVTLKRAEALQLAQFLVEGGGPAVIVAVETETRAHWTWDYLYREIVHDRPLDWIVPSLGRTALFGGSGREELLRYSPLALKLGSDAVVRSIARRATEGAAGGQRLVRGYGAARTMRIVQEAVERAIQTANVDSAPRVLEAAGRQLYFGSYDVARQTRFKSLVGAGLGERGLLARGIDATFDSMVQLNAGVVDSGLLGLAVARDAVAIRTLNPRAARNSLADQLRSVGGLAPKLEYEYRESGGMLPLAAKVEETRALLRKVQGRPGPARRAARHVNARLLEDRGAAVPTPLKPARARLRPGATVHLAVQIGPRDRELVQVGSTALIEELDRRPEGTWIEIGVTAYDFELLGDPVQQLWLPAVGASALASFALRVPAATTPLPGVVRVRFSIFHKDNVVQSFLVVARLATDAAGAADPMARALGVTRQRLQRLGDPGYVTRLEFHAGSIARIAEVPPRALSLIANDNAGDKVVTLKGGELFRVARRVDPLQVQAVRDALSRASTDDRKQYRYGFGGVPNTGDPAGLPDVMWELAREGWVLFSMLVPDEADQDAVRRRLDGGHGLRAAHVDITSVIPWAQIYDRPLQKRDEMDDPLDPMGPPLKVTRALCPVGLSAPGGAPSCGSVGCLLHPSENAGRRARGEPMVCEETVVCAQHFWGFRVPIEVPVQQVDGVAGRTPPPIRSQIATAKPLAIVAAFNPNLDRIVPGPAGTPSEGEHQAQMRKIVGAASASFTPPKRDSRQAVIDLLKQAQPDIVYLYCHGVPGGASNGRTRRDSLDFGRGHAGRAEDLVEGADLSGPAWTHGPLVFLNGCGTVGFTAYAPSDFVTRFIQGRKASAVIGTEVTVWEVLAREFAETFFTTMLANRKPGEALLAARRALLLKSNPLGLVYTLYGSFDLQA